MKSIKRIQGNSLYVLEGICCANTLFVENKRESDQFIRFIDRYLGDYATVYEFNINKNGWILLLRTKSDKTVRKHYLRKRQKHDKEGGIELFAVWDIISNAIRLMRSHFTKWTNDQRKRKGNASLRVFRRYLFTTVKEAREYIQKVRNQEIEMEQINPRYQANLTHYDEAGEIAENLEQMSSKAYQEEVFDEKLIRIRCLRIVEYRLEELGRWIKETCYRHGVLFETREMRDT